MDPQPGDVVIHRESGLPYQVREVTIGQRGRIVVLDRPDRVRYVRADVYHRAFRAW